MRDDFITKWVIDTVREKYADDIALVVSHTTLRMDPDRPAVSYFVPITRRGEAFARTFILEGIGYDIWGISWERLERFAALEEYNITVLADAGILYARTDGDRERFEALQEIQADNLADRKRSRIHALESYRQAKNIYLEMLFASGSDVRVGAGYVLDYLARAVAFSNHSYFRSSQTDQLRELGDMPDVPEGFAQLYSQVLFEKEEERQKTGCHQLICLIRDYLDRKAPAREDAPPAEQNYQDLADWYGELSYTFLRIRHYAQANDPVRVYMWGIYLQSELNQVCADFGIEKMDLMNAFDRDNLSLTARRSDEAERRIRTAITEGGGVIHKYTCKEEFLNEV